MLIFVLRCTISFCVHEQNKKYSEEATKDSAVWFAFSLHSLTTNLSMILDPAHMLRIEHSHTRLENILNSSSQWKNNEFSSLRTESLQQMQATWRSRRKRHGDRSVFPTCLVRDLQGLLSARERDKRGEKKKGKRRREFGWAQLDSICMIFKWVSMF